MIVVVEGASAAGKTTWCRAHAAGVTVAELPPHPAPKGGPREIAEHWVRRQAERWERALHVEAEHGRAFCDSDPLKLHYAWCLWQLGEIGEDHWRAACAAHRAALVGERLGFADLVVFLEAEPAELRRRREVDPTRSRRNFELHVRMAPLLRTWYEAVEGPDPGRMIRQRPGDGAIPSVAPRARRSDVALLDELLLSVDRRRG